MIECNDWKPIPGYDGWYEINTEGQIRSWKNYGHAKRKTPKILRQVVDKVGRAYVSLSLRPCVSQWEKVSRLVVSTFLGEIPDGAFVYHKNGDTLDNSVGNLGVASSEEAYVKMNKRGKNRRCVFKIDRNGEVLDIYPTVQEAARKNFLSSGAVTMHCRKQIKNPFRYLDFTFCYDKGMV